MPHIQIDYSPAVEQRLDLPELLIVLRDAALASGVITLAGIRVRATPVRHQLIADGNPDHAFVDISLRLRQGRDDVAKARALDMIFAAAERFCQPAMDSGSFMLSIELREIDAALSRKASSIRNYLPPEI